MAVGNFGVCGRGAGGYLCRLCNAVRVPITEARVTTAGINAPVRCISSAVATLLEEMDCANASKDLANKRCANFIFTNFL